MRERKKSKEMWRGQKKDIVPRDTEKFEREEIEDGRGRAKDRGSERDRLAENERPTREEER